MNRECVAVFVMYCHVPGYADRWDVRELYNDGTDEENAVGGSWYNPEDSERRAIVLAQTYGVRYLGIYDHTPSL